MVFINYDKHILGKPHFSLEAIISESKLLIVSCHPGITVLFEVVAIAVEVAE